MENISTYHSRKTSDVSNHLADFNLAALVSGSWYCTRWLAVTSQVSIQIFVQILTRFPEKSVKVNMN